MSPSGPPVTTYCSLAEAPGRSGCPSASFLPSSSLSWVSHLAMSSSSACRWHFHHNPLPTPSCGRMLPARRQTHPGEQVVLGELRVDEAARQNVLVVGVDGLHYLGRQPEPVLRRRIDLSGVREQRQALHVLETGQVD